MIPEGQSTSIGDHRRKGFVRRVLLTAGLVGATAVSLVTIGRTWPPSSPWPKFSVVVGLVPPHMNEDRTGREAEYLNRLFKGRDVTFFVQPFTRHWSSFLNDERFDAVATVPESMFSEGPGVHVFKSKPYIEYQNGVGFLSKTFPGGFEPAELGRRTDLRVAAFAGAADIVTELRGKTGKLALYIEVKDQMLQSILLKERKVDVVVEDELIFRCNNQRLDRQWAATSVSFKAFDEKTHYQVAFRRQEDRDAFDRRLESKKTDDIDRKYASDRGCSNGP
jgi:polar amino acid transport system substrate-binding protein